MPAHLTGSDIFERNGRGTKNSVGTMREVVNEQILCFSLQTPDSHLSVAVAVVPTHTLVSAQGIRNLSPPEGGSLAFHNF